MMSEFSSFCEENSVTASRIQHIFYCENRPTLTRVKLYYLLFVNKPLVVEYVLGKSFVAKICSVAPPNFGQSLL